MPKIVYPICCGMNVHKNFLVACIAIADDKGITTYKSKRFSTYSCSLRECRDCLLKYNCKVAYLSYTFLFYVFNLFFQTLSYLICQIFICLNYIP